MQSSLIVIAEVEERKKKRVKRRSVPSDTRTAHVADCFWFLFIFAWQETMFFPHLSECEAIT
jgi:hypothetical protein